ncbi:MAG: DUF4091 domain-containing protein [Actinobacteria bacterium]|jgi:hypothetical protein|nr:MAG: DUF4091 domain-containing protein [Actinomycetota bacterium]
MITSKPGKLTLVRAVIIALLFAISFIFVPAARAQPPTLRIWAVSDCDKILRYEAPWSASTVWSESSGKVVIHAARNEYVAFQVMITADGGDLYGVDMSCSALTGRETAIAVENIQLLREHYLNVTEPSTAMYGELSTTGPGWYPDPLVPLEAPDGGSPCDVPSGANQGVWVDIFVPQSASAGTYNGHITIAASGMASRTLPVELRVWDFSLPDEIHMSSFFMYQPGQIADAHGVAKYGDEYLSIEAEYARAARLHRCNLSTSVYPEYAGSGSGTVVIWDSWHDAFAERYLDGTIFADGRGSTPYALPIGQDYPDPADHGGLGSPEYEDTFIAMLQQFRDHFRERGWFDRSFLYIVDEPNDSEGYDLVRYYGGLVDRSGTGFPLMVTESPLPDEPSWGSLVGAVDIWCAGGNAWPGPMWERQAAGESCWTYNGGEPYAGSQIMDTSGLGPRTWAWIARRYGVECWLLWDACYFKDIYNGYAANDVWVDPLTFDQRRAGVTWPDWGNGDGTLFYPGTPRGIAGPVCSLRLKSWRRGAQDFEYMWLLEQRGRGGFVDNLVAEVIPSAFGDAEGNPTAWSKNASTWEEARIAMGNALAALPAYAYDYYFAEGYTGSGFQVWLCFGNSACEEIGVRITFLYKGLPPGEHYLTLPPSSRTTIYVNPYVGDDVEFSTMVESTAPLTCERPIYFDYAAPP